MPDLLTLTDDLDVTTSRLRNMARAYDGVKRGRDSSAWNRAMLDLVRDAQQDLVEITKALMPAPEHNIVKEGDFTFNLSPSSGLITFGPEPLPAELRESVGVKDDGQSYW